MNEVFRGCQKNSKHHVALAITQKKNKMKKRKIKEKYHSL